MKVRLLPSELQEKAKNELMEDPDKIAHGLNSLRTWLGFQKHLIFKDDDEFLLNFLRGCKFSIEKTKKKIDYYYTIRTLAPEFFDNRDPYSKIIQNILTSNLVSYYTPKITFPTICYCAWSEVEKNNITLEEISKHYFMAADALMNEDDSLIVNGIVIIMDMKDVSLKYLLQCSIPIIKKYFFIIQHAYPIRIKAVCVINAPSYIYTIYKMCELIFSQKIRNRIHLLDCENFEKLHDILPQEYLPNELGGNAGHLAKLTGDWKKKLESYYNWFKEDQKYKSIEELRLGQPKTHSEVFGQEGSFRQLNFD